MSSCFHDYQFREDDVKEAAKSPRRGKIKNANTNFYITLNVFSKHSKVAPRFGVEASIHGFCFLRFWHFQL